MPIPVDETIRHLYDKHPKRKDGWKWYAKEQLPLASITCLPRKLPTGPSGRCGSANVKDPNSFEQAAVEIRDWLLQFGVNARCPHDPVLEEMNFFQLKMYYYFSEYFYGITHRLLKSRGPPLSRFSYEDRAIYVTQFPQACLSLKSFPPGTEAALLFDRPADQTTDDISLSSEVGETKEPAEEEEEDAKPPAADEDTEDDDNGDDEEEDDDEEEEDRPPARDAAGEDAEDNHNGDDEEEDPPPAGIGRGKDLAVLPIHFPLRSTEISDGVRDEHHAFDSQCAEFLSNVYNDNWPVEFPKIRKTQYFRNILA